MSIYTEWFHRIFNKFIGPSEQDLVKVQWLYWSRCNCDHFCFIFLCIQIIIHQDAPCSVIIMNVIIQMYCVKQEFKIFKIDMDKKLSCFQVYGYCKVAINVLKKKPINTLLICGGHKQYTLCITTFNKWQIERCWMLFKSSFQPSRPLLF